jgi:hypothetical protein
VPGAEAQQDPSGRKQVEGRGVGRDVGRSSDTGLNHVRAQPQVLVTAAAAPSAG